MQRFLSILPDRFKWTVHNVIAHPFSELLFQVGLEKASNWLHDITVPDQGPGRG
jgi:hypothetical protein